MNKNSRQRLLDYRAKKAQTQNSGKKDFITKKWEDKTSLQKSDVSIRAKKSLGQNFLKSTGALHKIVEAGELTQKSIVLEIGPGTGALTEKLLETGATVIAVEKDHELILFLQEKFASYSTTKKFQLHEGDILTVDLKKIGIQKTSQKKYTLIANIPYYITGEIIRLFLDHEHKPETIVFLVQKEVAERIVKKDGKESILSLAIQAYGKARYIETVPRGAFVPSPKVDSAIIQIKKSTENNFKNKETQKKFFETIKAGSKSKRKYAFSNLQPLFSKQVLETFFEKSLLDKKTRAEKIPFPVWLALSKNL